MEEYRLEIVTEPFASAHLVAKLEIDYATREEQEGVMSELRVLLLGPPRIEVDGRPLQVDTRKAIALLAYLATCSEASRRDSLAALLWPEHDNDSARGALRRTLSTLKKALGGKWLEVDRATVALAEKETFKDVAQLHCALDDCQGHGHASSAVCNRCEAPLVAAVGLYRGDFMTGFSLRDSVEFDDWQLLQAEHFRRLASGALERLVRCVAIKRDLSPAIEYARRWLALEPLHEPAHRQLMLLHAWAGDRSAAIKQYRDCVAVLDRELGVAPLDQTAELYQAIMENRAPPLEAGPDVAVVAGNGKPVETGLDLYPLTGRAIEWTALLDAYERVGANGHVAAIQGEAGIGKTRLCNDFLEEVRTKGAVAVTARCHEGETDLTYGPVIDLLRGALESRDDKSWLGTVGQQHLVEVARLVPELRHSLGLPDAPDLTDPGAKSRFYEGLAHLLSTACEGPPHGVLFVDDVQWIDEASAELLAFMCMRLTGRPLLLVLAWRSEQVRGHDRLIRLLPQLQSGNTITSIKLNRLDEGAVRELVGHVGPGDHFDDELGSRLYRETDGLPMFVVEYLRALTSEGTSIDEPWEPPSGVRDLLTARIAASSQTARQVLAAAAVIGGSFDFDVLKRSAGRSEDEVVSALEELVNLNLVMELDTDRSTPPSYDFSHSLLREFAYQEINAARRRLLHGRVGDALARSRGRPDAMAGAIARHYELAGREQDAAAFYETAGRHARSLFAYGEALEHFGAALALDHPEPGRLHEAIGDLHTLRGEYKLAVTSYETAAALSSVEALIDLEHKLGNVHDRRGDWDAAESHFDAALTALENELDPRTPRLLADKSLTLHHRRRSDQAFEVAEQALELAVHVADERSLAQAHNILGILSSRRDRLEDGRRHLEESLNLAESLGDENARAAALNNLALTIGSQGDYDRAIALAQTALELCKKHRDRHREAALNNNLADLLHAAGRSDESMNYLREAVKIFAEIGADAGDLEPQIWKLVEW